MTRQLEDRLSKIERRAAKRLSIVVLCRICDERIVTLDSSRSWERQPNERAESFEHRVCEEARRGAMHVLMLQFDAREL